LEPVTFARHRAKVTGSKGYALGGVWGEAPTFPCGLPLRAALRAAVELAPEEMRLLPGPQVMIGQAHTRFDASGTLVDEGTRKFLAGLLVALRDWTLRLRG
jgi:hypothetical protein